MQQQKIWEKPFNCDVSHEKKTISGLRDFNAAPGTVFTALHIALYLFLPKPKLPIFSNKKMSSEFFDVVV